MLQGFHQDPLPPNDPIHRQTAHLPSGSHDHDGQFPLGFPAPELDRPGHSQRLFQMPQRQDGPVVGDRLLPVQNPDLPPADDDRFEEGGKRQGVLLSPRLHQQHLQHGHRDRHLQTDARGPVLLALQGHVAPQLLQVVLDHIQTDPPPRNPRRLGRGAEPRGQDEIGHLLGTHGRQSLFADQPHLQPLPSDRLDIDPSAVIDHLDNRQAPLAVGGDRDRSPLRLALLHPLRSRFNAVIHGVADEVHQRVYEQFDDFAIDLRFFSQHGQFDLLAGALRQLAHHPGEPFEQRVDAHQSQRHDAVLEPVGDAANAFGHFPQLPGRLGRPSSGSQPGEGVLQPVFGNGKLRHLIHEVVHLVGRHPQFPLEEVDWEFPLPFPFRFPSAHPGDPGLNRLELFQEESGRPLPQGAHLFQRPLHLFHQPGDLRCAHVVGRGVETLQDAQHVFSGPRHRFPHSHPLGHLANVFHVLDR